ncbi:pentapeptide repeat-containing protein [Sphaerisporangium sp. NPDC049002]|uniref:pentapeptide repeat-containing protein n=1 Tax=Sphaerisporangium sp. NPDC049002 TaxID=3155392 RepID=UPI0033F76C3A
MSDEREHAEAVAGGGRLDLRADCERCFALCCVAPAFSPSADFAIDKAAGRPCPNLAADFRCGIHTDLRRRGFPGCTVYDCFGAGQKVAQVTFGGQDWRRAPRTAKRMFEVFTIMRHLHELLWYLDEALTLEPARPIHGELRLAFDRTERLTHGDPGTLVELDVAAHRQEVNALLLRTSELVRAGVRRGKKDRRGADLIGADLRDADLSGADLTGSIFLIQSQLQSAKGDAGTKLPPSLTHPAHW